MSVKSLCIPSFVLIGHCFSELHAHLCPYRNVWPEAVYYCLLYHNFWCVSEKPVYTKLCLDSVSYMPIYVPIVMYGPRLFIVVLHLT